jgi:RND family efflux transporter MFP subunit
MLAPSTAKAIGVQIGKVELAEVRRTIRATGSVELPWSQQAYVTTLVPGRIERVLVKPGEAVSAGQELARVSGVELETLQLALVQAWREKALAVRLLEAQEAAGAGVAGKVLLEARTEAQLQATRLEVAWEKLKALGLSDESLSRICESGRTVPSLSIASPISGVVAMADVQAGQIVEPAEHLYHIVDLSRVWIAARVLEADASRVKAGLPTEATFTALPDAFRAPIDHVELRLNADRTLSAKAVVDNPGGRLRPGMFGRVEIELAAEKAVVCPRDALVREGQPFALVQQTPGNFVRKPVAIAAVRGSRAEIRDGLFPGDKVVTVGSHELGALFVRLPTKQAPLSVPRGGMLAHGQIELPTDRKTLLSAPLEARVRRILVEHGQRVEAGQILAELDSLSLRNLQLDLRQARASLARAEQNFAKVESLRDSIARQEFWQLQTQRDTLRQTVDSLEKQLSLLGAGADEPVLAIRAPSAGLVSSFDLLPGQVVNRQDLLFELHDPARVWARAYVFEQEVPRVRVGQEVRVRLAADPDFQASAAIDRLDPVLVEGNRALAVWAELDNPDLRLKAGMAATITFDAPADEAPLETATRER